MKLGRINLKQKNRCTEVEEWTKNLFVTLHQASEPSSNLKYVEIRLFGICRWKTFMEAHYTDILESESKEKLNKRIKT